MVALRIIQFLLITIMLFSGWCPLKAQTALKGVQPVKVQMHLHALSNHNGANQPASMQYHNQWADTFNMQVVWWTEHINMYKQKDVDFQFTGGTINTNFDITGLGGSAGKIDMWKADYNSSNINSSITDSSLTMGVNAAPGSGLTRYFTYEPQGTNGKLTNTDKYIKTLTCRPVFECLLTPFDLLDTKCKIQVVFALSFHFNPSRKQQVLICNFVDSSNSKNKYLSGSDTVFVDIPVFNNQSQLISVDLADAVSLLPDSIDNVIQKYFLKVESIDGNPVAATFSNMRVYTPDSKDTLSFNKTLELMDQYYNKYSIKNYLGVEFTGSHGNFDHIIGHLPFKPGYDDIVAKGITNNDHLDYVNHIHNLGGLATYTHPYGSTNFPLYSQSVQDYREDTMLNYLLNLNVFNCDMIEAAYKVRGNTDLQHHLSLWDRLNAHGRFIYGVGNNDLHGDPWSNYYISWIWSANDEPASLIAAAKKGRIYFGVAEMWDGIFDFTVGDNQMGERVLGIYTQAPLAIYMSPQIPGMKVKVTQGIIDSTSLVVNYLLNDSIIDINNSFQIDLTQPCFVRISVYDSLDNPVVFGNPIIYETGGILNPIVNNDEGYKKEFYLTANPNPIQSFTNIRLSNLLPGTVSIQITDIAGTFNQTVLTKNCTETVENFQIDLSDIKPGTYLLKAINEGQSTSSQIIKN